MKPTLGEMFSKFKKSAKRLELLQEYQIEGGEWESFQAFLNGEIQEPYAELREWNDQISKWHGEGKEIERIRLIDSPLTDYLKYEIFEGYIPSSLVGQNVNFVFRDEFEKICNRKNVKDFWMFDDRYVFEMLYDKNGAFVGANFVDGAEQKEIYSKLKAISHPMQEILKEIRSQKFEIRKN